MYIVDLAFQSSVLLGLAGGAHWFTRRRSAALRHLVLSLAFGGVLLLPLASVVLPTIHLPVRSSLPADDVLFKAEANGPQAPPAKARNPAAVAVGLLDWNLLFDVVWACGAVLGLGRMSMGWYRLEKLRARAAIFAPPVEGVEVLEAEAGSMPMTYGFWRPVIFLPQDARMWTKERLQIVMQHELAHVRRGDSALQVVARLASSVYWWNPLAWWLSRSFVEQQERAADDFVLNSGVARLTYAEHLLQIARSMQMQPHKGSLAMASKSGLAGRMTAILDSGRDRRSACRAVRLAAFILTAGLVLPLAAMRLTPLTGTQGEPAAKDHIRRGVLELVKKDYSSALSDFEAAANGNSRSEALMWEGVAKEGLGSADEAQKFFDESVSLAPPGSPELATVLEVYGRFLEDQGKQDEAARMKERAKEIRSAYVPAEAPHTDWSATAVRVGSGVKSPRVSSKIEPEYTPEARAAKYSGAAVLSVVIGTDGKTHDIQIKRGLGLGLDEKAVEAVSQWTFEPGTKDGQAVNVRATIEVNFRLL